MAIRTQVVTDGVVSEKRTVITPPRSKTELREAKHALRAFTREHNRLLTFNGRVADLERTCRRTPGVRDQPRQAFGSRAWYAGEILLTIRIVREALAVGDVQHATSQAVVVGALAAEAEARHNWTVVQRWLGYLARQRAAAKAGAEVSRETAASSGARLHADVAACRQKHPDWSISRMALSLLPQHGRPDGPATSDRQHALRALAKRIARLGLGK